MPADSRRPFPLSRRRAALAGAAALLTVAPLALGGAGASATAPAPAVRAIAGNRTMTLAWSAVAGATGYTVRWSAKGVKARAATVAGRSLRLTKLPNDTNWTVRVTPRGAAATAATAAVRTSDHYPYAMSDVRVVPAGANQVRVTWSGGGRATRVGVIAGADHDVTLDRFHSAWYPATTHSILLTVPTRLRTRLGTGTGNYVFARVVETNSAASDPAFHWASDQKGFRRSTTAPSALAGTVAAPDPASVSHVAVAELNTQTVDASSGFSVDHRWAKRVDGIVHTVLAAAPAVLLTSELSTRKLDDSCTGDSCATQYTDLLEHIRSAQTGGQDYRLATDDAAANLVTETHEHDWLHSPTDGAQIIYDASRLTLLDHGYISPVLDLKVHGWSTGSDIPDRLLSWAEFEAPATAGQPARRFYAVAVHFPAVTSTEVSRFHIAEAAALGSWLSANLDPSLPIVMGGDFNADPTYPKYGAEPNTQVLLGDGFTDAAAVADRTGQDWATFNDHNGTGGADYGYPSTAKAHGYPYTRIDFVLLKGAAHSYSWRNVLHLTADGAHFDPFFQGTDHNLQLADIGIG